MNSRNRIASLARAFSLFALLAIFVTAAFPSASQAAAARKAAPVATGKITIRAIDMSSGKAVAGAEVIFRRADSRVIVSKGVTSSLGVVTVEVPVATYVVDIEHPYYKHATDSVSAAAGVNTDVKVPMYPDSTVSDPPPPMLSID